MKKITLLLTLLLCVAGTAWAQFTQKWSQASAPWPNEAVDASKIPANLVICDRNHDANHTATRMGLMPVTLTTPGQVTVEFVYTGGSHAVHTLGVDIVNESGVVVQQHYENGHIGTNARKTYTLDMSAATAGNYTLRYFVCHKASDHEVTNTAGTINVTGLAKRKYTDVANASAIASNKAYILYTAKAGVRVNPAGTGLFALGDGSRSSELDEKCKFAFITDPADNSKKYLWSVSQNGFVTKTGAISTQAADALTFDASSTTDDTEDNNGLKIKFSTGSDKVFQVNSAFTGVVIGQSTTQSVYNTFHICEAGDFNPSAATALLNNRISFTYSYTVNGTQVATEAVNNVFVGANYPAPTTLESYVDYTALSGTVAADDAGTTKEIVCQAAPNSQFTLSTDGSYFGLVTRDQGKALKVVNGQPGLTFTLLGLNNWTADAEAYSWTLEGTWYEGFKLKNKAGYYLAPGTSNNDGTALTLTSKAAQAILLCVNKYDATQYLFYVKGTERYLSDHGGTTNSLLKYYNGKNTNFNDGGSKFTVYDVTEAYQVNKWKNERTPLNNKPYVGCYTADYSAAINACTKVAHCIEFDNTHSTLAFDATKYYMFVNAHNRSAAIYEDYATENSETGGYRVKQGTITGNRVPFLWKFQLIDDGDFAGKYFIKNPNGNFFNKVVHGSQLNTTNTSSATGGNTNDASTSTVFTLTKDYITSPGMMNIRWWRNASVMDGTLDRNGDGTISSWNADGTNNDWYILPVESIELDITAAGWASVNLPFAVQMPAGVTAYAVTRVEGNTVYGEEITGGIVPAYTPVFVAGTEGTKTLSILYGNNSSYAKTNKLHGSTKPETVTAGQYYGLKANGAAATLVPYNVTTLPANKAVLAASNVPAESGNAAALLFDFSGDVTGINPAISAGEKEVYYDLNGRVVAFPANGVFVKSNGQKVLIK